MSISQPSWTRFALFALLASTPACMAQAESSDMGSQEASAGDQTDPIIGGVVANQFPEAALINMAQNGQIVAACSGTVIAPRVVLTAGHCVFGFDAFVVKAPFAGNQRAQSTKGLVFDYEVDSEFVDATKHDVGLVVLDTPIQLNSFPKLATSKVANGTKVVNIGRIQNGRLSNRALFVSPSIRVQDARSSGFPFDYLAVDKIESGDSGGPDMIAGTHTIVSVNSGAGGGTEVLARIDLLADFIQQTIAENGGGG
jgi:hypothetical protein